MTVEDIARETALGITVVTEKISKMRKIPVHFFRGSAPRFIRKFGSSKKTEEKTLTVFGNLRRPLLSDFVEVDSAKTRFVGGRRPHVHGVLRSRAASEVGSAVIQSDAVSVIPDQTLGLRIPQSEDLTVHQNPPLRAVWGWSHCAHGVETTLPFGCEPSPLIQPLIISGIDNRHLSLIEGDVFDGGVVRLRYWASRPSVARTLFAAVGAVIRLFRRGHGLLRETGLVRRLQRLTPSVYQQELEAA